MLGASASSRARSRQLGHTAYREPQVAGKRGAFLGAGTTVQRCAGVGESCSSPRGTATGFPFTSSVASLDVSLTIRYHAPRRSGVFTFSLRRAHWNACIVLSRALRGDRRKLAEATVD